MSSQDMTVLIPDGENNGLAYRVISCLSGVPRIRIHVLSNVKNVPIRYSRYISQFTYYPPSGDPLGWIAKINKEVAENGVDFILPVGIKGIRNILKFKDNPKIKSNLVVLPDFEEFGICCDKRALATHCNQYNISRPDYFLPDQKDKWDELGFPVLVKDADEGTGSGSGVRKFNNIIDLSTYLDKDNRSKTTLVERFVNGYDIDCSVLCVNGVIKAYTIQKGMDYGKKAFSPPISVEFVESPRLLEVVEELMSSLKWNGVAHIDMRYDQDDESFKVIEINPRYWFSLDASLIAGVNFPLMHLLSSQDQDFKIPAYKSIKAITLKGFLKNLRRTPLLLFRFKYLWNHSSLKFIVKDPIPVLIQFVQWTQKHLFVKS